METVLNSVVDRLRAGLGSRLDAVYLFGSLATGTFQPDESAVDLLLVTADDTTIADVHDTFHPIWLAHGRSLRHAPLLTSASAFQSHMTLLPVLSGHLKHHGRTLAGSVDRLQTLPEPARLQIEAAHAYRALTLSSLLFNGRFPEADRAENMRQLRRLARHLTHVPAPQKATAVDLFSGIHRQLDDIGTPPDSQPPDAPLPGLVSIVHRAPHTTIFVFDALSPERIRSIDWPDAAAKLLPSNQRPAVTTYGHLQTFVPYETAIDHAFKRFSTQWGLDPFVALNVPGANVIRQAGRRPCGLRLDTLPRTYLTAANPNNTEFVHNFQNRLLNVQLEHEILCRLQLSKRFQPTRPLPDRTAPAQARIAATFDQLDEWVAFYAEKIWEMAA